MECQATAKYIKNSPRKIRLVADAIRQMKPIEAQVYLSQISKQAANPLGDVISSALANAKNQNAQLDSLIFKSIEIMGGPVLKRWHAVSRGSAHTYKKRMTHIRIILTDSSVQKSPLHSQVINKKIEKLKKETKK